MLSSSQVIWLTIYPALCIFVPCIFYQVICLKKSPPTEKIRFSACLWRWIFILYLYISIDAAGIGTIWDIGQYGNPFSWDQINLLPMQSAGLMTYLLNIIMFMPLGFLLPLIWQRFRKIRRTALTGLGFSLMIELAQLLNIRVTDIDDLLMNLLGTLAGFLLWKLFFLIFRRPAKEVANFGRYEAKVYIILALTGTFLLYN